MIKSGDRMEKVLRDICIAEEHADKVLKEAQEKAIKIVANGKTDAAAFLKHKKQELLADKAAALAERKKSLEKEEKTYLKNAEKQADDLAKIANKQKKKALSFLLDEFNKQVIA
jgi:vacuolar-type H+-ATPase subunit H